MAITNRKKPSKKAQYEFKSKFEGYVAEYLDTVCHSSGGNQYEVDTLAFVQPAAKRKYKPDFRIGDNTYIECKGIFSVEDRKKMLWVKEQHPEVTIYLLFYNANQKLRKGSKTSYGDWATEHGFVWSDWYRNGRKIPSEWFDNNNNNKGTHTQ